MMDEVDQEEVKDNRMTIDTEEEFFIWDLEKISQKLLENEEKEVDESKRIHKEIEYFQSDENSRFIIVSFKFGNKMCFQLSDIIDDELVNSTYSYLKNEKMSGSHVLNLINRKAQNDKNKRTSL